MSPPYVYAAVLERVVDADTVDVDMDLGMHVHLKARLRIAHIDAPEKWTPAGKLAAAYVTDLLPVGLLLLVATQKPDKYGRALADVTLPDGQDLATIIVAAGHAVPYEGGPR